jgi:hypothetical protein
MGRRSWTDEEFLRAHAECKTATARLKLGVAETSARKNDYNHTETVFYNTHTHVAEWQTR